MMNIGDRSEELWVWVAVPVTISPTPPAARASMNAAISFAHMDQQEHGEQTKEERVWEMGGKKIFKK